MWYDDAYTCTYRSGSGIYYQYTEGDIRNMLLLLEVVCTVRHLNNKYGYRDLFLKSNIFIGYNIFGSN